MSDLFEFHRDVVAVFAILLQLPLQFSTKSLCPILASIRDSVVLLGGIDCPTRQQSPASLSKSSFPQETPRARRSRWETSLSSPGSENSRILVVRRFEYDTVFVFCDHFCVLRVRPRENTKQDGETRRRKYSIERQQLGKVKS